MSPEVLLQRLSPAFVALAVCALWAPAASSGADKPCVATLKAPGHHPKADKLWPIVVTCRTPSGKPVRATATYQFLYQGQVVATRYPSPKADPKSKCSKEGTCRKSPYPFNGRLRDATFTWPRRAVIGDTLTLRVIVKVKGKGSVNLDYDVTVHK
jgi:hypothetical protein